METINKIIVNCETNETQIIPLDNDELKELAKQSSQNQKDQLKLKAEAEAKAAQRQAILDRLGLSSDEAKLLLG